MAESVIHSIDTESAHMVRMCHYAKIGGGLISTTLPDPENALTFIVGQHKSGPSALRASGGPRDQTPPTKAMCRHLIR